jgi:hypothetical protein
LNVELIFYISNNIGSNCKTNLEIIIDDLASNTGEKVVIKFPDYTIVTMRQTIKIQITCNYVNNNGVKFSASVNNVEAIEKKCEKYRPGIYVIYKLISNFILFSIIKRRIRGFLLHIKII